MRKVKGKMKPKISVVLAVYNEEKQLDRCLQAVKDYADEIVIVDGSSTDKTMEIAKKYTNKIIITDNPPIFHINKQKALQAASNEWVLQLDADEVVTPELWQEIFRRVKKEETKLKNKQIYGFYIPRKNFFLTRFLTKGGQYPDYVIRLVRKSKAHFPCQSIHEQIAIKNNRVGYLTHPLLHYGTTEFSRYILRDNRYSSLTAKFWYESGVRPSFKNFLYYFIYKPIYTFLSIYLRHKGFVDGFPGFVFALFSALHFNIAYIKLHQLTSYPQNYFHD